MPTYEYGCSACGREWEEIQRITAPPTETCPECGKATAHRLISAGTNFILKGGGWYSDLYSSPGKGAKAAASEGATADAPAASGEAKAAPKAEGASETKSETKASAPASPAPSTSSTS